MSEHTPRILIIYTGGTIGMIDDPVTHTLRPFDFTHLIDNVPKINLLGYQIDNISFAHPIDSSDMDTERWIELAHIIEYNYDGYDGFLILHGTDTMAYTASALSFMLRGLRKPVIITGSQLPIGEVRTDGEENLITALQIAAATDANGSPMVQEVAILFEDYLWRGNRSTKMSADNFNAFRSNNYPELAHVGLGINFNKEALYRPTGEPTLMIEPGMSTDVMFINIFPGITESTLKHLLSTPGIRGFVMRTFGAGNAPTAEWFARTVREAVNAGKVIVNVTQCVNGSVSPLYAAGNALASAGVISGHDITAEAAITKLMHLFGQGYTVQGVRTRFAEDLRGEITVDKPTN